MDNLTKQSNSSQELPFSHPRALRDILIVGAPIIILAAAGNVIGVGTLVGGAIINLGYVLMIILGGFILKRQSSNWSEIGMGKPAGWLKTALFGVGAFVSAVVVFLAMQTIIVGLLTTLGMALPEINQSRFNEIEGNLPLLILMVILAWTTIAFGEEMYYRAFIITRIVDLTPMGHWLAILIAGIIFGVAHFAEGSLGILSNGSFGILFGWIYIRTGRNLWITIIGHGLLNTLRFVLLYAGLA
jgi:membrane protease YdiL (CAAX protease family)